MGQIEDEIIGEHILNPSIFFKLPLDEFLKKTKEGKYLGGLKGQLNWLKLCIFVSLLNETYRANKSEEVKEKIEFITNNILEINLTFKELEPTIKYVFNKGRGIAKKANSYLSDETIQKAVLQFRAREITREIESKINTDKFRENQDRELSKLKEQLRKGKKELEKKDKEILEGKKELEKKVKELLDKKKRKGHTALSIHGISQFFGDSKQQSIFSDAMIDNYVTTTGVEIKNRPTNFGVSLNQSQRRVLDGILKAFSETRYKGDEQIDKATYNKNIHPIIKAPGAYDNINNIPVIRLTQGEIIELSGYNLKAQKQGDKVDVVDAISFLATRQFYFYWLRAKTDNKGAPIKDKNGDYIKEEVSEISTLLRIKTIREKDEVKYYEIHPSSVLLDQVNKEYGGNYFLLVPDFWRDEVKQLTGKRASSYTYELLLWLRLQYEQIRRHNSTGKKAIKEFILKKAWEEIAEALKMPKSMYKANRKRASSIIQGAYDIAIELGYLVKVENNGAIDTLYLNERFYPKPGALK